ncbi:DUF6712 family protein [Dyadobacter sp. CY343]|uniref:DUF6712 family protein n=1 Tax=Dyadobacter sp. CY343 TaxID=2907299 RepID=UPI001F48C433|nr:DUF6712 family protein [Dyadobacter sp. CY343]MCE7061244.1 hypothetical protein [Dyadobacter sp. CY343]
MIVGAEEFKEHLGGIQTSLKFGTVEPFIKVAEREFRKAVGVELYDFLNEKEFDSFDDLEKELLGELRNVSEGCVAWAAYDLALPQLKMRVGDMGLMKSSPAQTVAIAKWEYADTRDANMTMVDMHWEFFWELLEEIKPDVWTESEAFKRRNTFFIRSADELSDYVALVGKNRRLFAKLERFIHRGEQLYIRDLITPAVFDALKAKWKSPNEKLSPAELLLVEKIREPLAYLTLHEAYPYLPIKVDENGLRDVRKWDGITNESAAGAEVRNAQRQQLWQDAQLYLGRLRTFMDTASSPNQFQQYYTAVLAAPVEEQEDFTYKSHVIL